MNLDSEMVGRRCRAALISGLPCSAALPRMGFKALSRRLGHNTPTHLQSMSRGSRAFDVCRKMFQRPFCDQKSGLFEIAPR